MFLIHRYPIPTCVGRIYPLAIAIRFMHMVEVDLLGEQILLSILAPN